MKAASAPLRALVESGVFQRADLFTLTLVDGTIIRWTSADVSLVWGGQTHLTISIVRDMVRVALGFSVDQMKLLVYPLVTDLVAGLPFGQAVRGGLLDGARLLVQKAYLETWPTIVGVLHGFQGSVSDIDGSRTEFKLMVKSALELLNIDMPREVYQSTCLHVVYDQGCTLSKAPFVVAGAVTGTPTLNSVASDLGQADEYFDQGVIALTSGPCAGSRRTVRSFVSGVFTFALPLPVLPAAGNTFTVYPGCDRRQETCLAKFNNTAHFKGYPYVPTPETAF